MSPQEPVHQPQHEAEDDAQDDTGSDREEHRSILSAVADVARQASERQVGASGEQDDKADQDQQSSCANQQLTEGIHDPIL